MSPCSNLRHPSFLRTRLTSLCLTLVAIAAAGCGDPIVQPPLATAPTVTSTSPASAATNVAVNAKLSATFDIAMAPLGLDSFTLKQGSTAVAGAVTNSAEATSATFTPSSALTASTVYTATITTGAVSAAGTPLAANHTWSFTTGAAADTTPPVVSATLPAADATSVSVSTVVTATFSKELDPLSVTGATVSLKQGSTAVAGVVTYAASVATFTAAAPLSPNTAYTATIGTGIKDMKGNTLANAFTWSFTTGGGVAAPSVSSTSPVANATNVAASSIITVTFSKAMDSTTVNATNFTVKQGANAVAGALAYSGTVATFTPAAALAASAVYTVTLGTGLKDQQGNALAAPFILTFTTAAAPNAPTVTGTLPALNATNVPINTQIAATFSASMNASTFTTTSFTLKNGANAVAGSVAYGSNNTAKFTPASPLAANTLFTASFTTDVKDAQGIALAAAFSWTFTTGAAADTTPPVVSSTVPANNDLNVPVGTPISATFSKAMDPLTITTTSFSMKQGNNAVLGNVSYGPGTQASFSPSAPLASNTVYSLTITTAVKDLNGNALANNYTWSFTTAAPPAPRGPAPVSLGTAGNFVILAKSAISTVPTSAITGDIGLGPAAASFMTGFSLVADASNVFSRSSQLVGKAYAASYAPPTPANMTTAVANMETAYTDAANRPTPDFLELGTGNIGGKTLAPGLYKWTSTVTIPTDVTINGGANDTWIFQTTGDLTMSAAKKVLLSGGAQAKNIVWQIAGKVVVGAGAHFEGIILCKTEVTLATGASMNGRILAQTQVALQSATLTGP